MSVTGFVVLAIAVWATFASVRTIQRIGLRRFGKAVGRLGWDLGKVVLGGAASVAGALAAAAPRNTGEDPFDDGHDLLDSSDPVNYVRTDSPYYVGDKKEGEV